MVVQGFLHAAKTLGQFGTMVAGPKHEEKHGEEGIPLVVQEALLWSVVSTLSLPIGAVLGIYFSPVHEAAIAYTIAFGAGALLFAVTVELYGEQLMRMERDGFEEGLTEAICCLLAAVAGAVIYTVLNRWVEGRLPNAAVKKIEEEEDKVEIHTEKAPKKSFKAAANAVISQLRVKHLSTRSRMVHHEEKSSSGVAVAMLIGVCSDAIPEAILLGFMASEDKLSMMFIVALFIANFPESFSSASILRQGNVYPSWKIIGLWTIPLCVTGIFAAAACWAIPHNSAQSHNVKIAASVIEGLAGGMMLAMISSVMLPEAYLMAKKEGKDEDRRDVPGIFCVCGFLAAVALKVFGGYAEEIF